MISPFRNPGDGAHSRALIPRLDRYLRVGSLPTPVGGGCHHVREFLTVEPRAAVTWRVPRAELHARWAAFRFTGLSAWSGCME